MFFNKSDKIKRELQHYDCAIITGASSGIGSAFLDAIKAHSSIPVCNISRRENTFADIQILADLSSKQGLEIVKKEIFNFLQKIDKKNPKILLINNAGFGGYGYFPSPSLEHNLKMIDVNIKALTYLCGILLDVVKSGNGSIINIASTAAFEPCPNLSVYAATKSYVYSFTQSLSYEMRGKAKCLCICPGPTSSNFFKAAGFDTPPLPSGFGHKAEDVAFGALLALAKGKSLKVIGFVNTMQSLLVRILPSSLLLRISGKILDKIR